MILPCNTYIYLPKRQKMITSQQHWKNCKISSCKQVLSNISCLSLMSAELLSSERKPCVSCCGGNVD